VCGCEMLAEEEVLGFGEGACAHSHKMANVVPCLSCWKRSTLSSMFP
jgi:hypothetical protein